MSRAGLWALALSLAAAALLAPACEDFESLKDVCAREGERPSWCEEAGGDAGGGGPPDAGAADAGGGGVDAGPGEVLLVHTVTGQRGQRVNALSSRSEDLLYAAGTWDTEIFAGGAGLQTGDPDESFLLRVGPSFVDRWGLLREPNANWALDVTQVGARAWVGGVLGISTGGGLLDQTDGGPASFVQAFEPDGDAGVRLTFHNAPVGEVRLRAVATPPPGAAQSWVAVVGTFRGFANFQVTSGSVPEEAGFILLLDESGQLVSGTGLMVLGCDEGTPLVINDVAVDDQAMLHFAAWAEDTCTVGGRTLGLGGGSAVYLSVVPVSPPTIGALEFAFPSAYRDVGVIGVGGDRVWLAGGLYAEPGRSDVAAAVFNKSAGTLDQVWSFGGAGEDRALGVHVEPDGTAYITGRVAAGASLLPDGGGPIPLTGATAAFVSRLSPDAGVLWTRTYGSDTDSEGLGITRFGDRLAVGGWFTGTLRHGGEDKVAQDEDGMILLLRP